MPLDGSYPHAALSKAEVEVLERGGFMLDEGLGQDLLSETAIEYVAFLKTSLSVRETAERLGANLSRVRRRLTSKPPTLYGVRVGARWYVAEFQFDGDKAVQGIEEVVSHLDPHLHPIAVARWFATPSPDLSINEPNGRYLSPRDWLRQGLPIQVVVELASNL
jgi:hypothetical protein